MEDAAETGPVCTPECQRFATGSEISDLGAGVVPEMNQMILLAGGPETQRRKPCERESNLSLEITVTPPHGKTLTSMTQRTHSKPF